VVFRLLSAWQMLNGKFVLLAGCITAQHTLARLPVCLPACNTYRPPAFLPAPPACLCNPSCSAATCH